MAITLPATGGCQCGSVTYTLTAEPLFTYACHCHTCQHRTGSACSVALVVPLDGLDIKGDMSAWERISDKGEVNTRYSCPDCSNVIHGISASTPTVTKLQSGTLDDGSAVAPDVHMWTQSKQGWISINAGVPQFATQPDDPMELLHAAMEYRAGQL